MAMIPAVIQSFSRNGVSFTYAAANADGYSVPGDGLTMLHFKNTGVLSTITVDIPVVVEGVKVAPKTITLPATSGDVWVGPWPAGIYNQGAGTLTGRVLVTLSSVAGVTVAAVRVPQS